MTSLMDPWMRPLQRGVRSAAGVDRTHFSPHRHQHDRYYDDHQHHHHHPRRADYATAASATAAAGEYVLYSPTTSRRKIAELERRLTELRSNSQSMTQQLGQAERSLRALDLDTAAGHRRPDLVRFSGDDTDGSSSSSSDDEGGHVRRRHSRHRRHGSRHLHGDRDALRREIAQIHEDLRVLRRQSSSYDDVRGPAALRRDVIGDDTLMTDWGRNQLVRSSTDDALFLRDGYSRRHRYNYDGDISPTCCADDLRGFGRRGNSAMMSGAAACCTDARHGLHQGHRATAAGVMSPTCCSGTGLRSVLYKAPLTQHNRTLLSSPGPTHRNWYDSFDTASKRAFKPYQPSEVTIGDIVKFRRSGGRFELGRVLYVGHLPGKSGAYLGVELENATGNHDGLNGGFRYYQCKPNRGLFVSFDKVIMAWSNY